MDERRDKNRIRFVDAERAVREAQGTPTPARQQGSFGTWLRAQREARGVSMDAIAEGSKISRRYLEALEHDRFDALPAPVFVRGFLREYARIVGLDPDEVVNFYLLARPAASRERAGPGQASPPSRERPSPRRSSSLVAYGGLLAALVVIVVAIAAAISWWAGRRTAEQAPASGGAHSPRATVAAAASSEPAAPAPSEPAAATPAERAAPAAAGESTMADSPPNAQIPSPAVAPATSNLPGAPAAARSEDRLRVVLEFRQDCWVDVVVDGRRRESELKAGGETLALEADDYVLLTLGNGPAVRVEVNGEPFGLPDQGSRVVRDLRIDRTVAAARRRASGEPLRP